MREVSIIIPTLNESENIASLVERIFSVVRTASITAEIIIVDDGSTDGTREIAAALEKKHPLLLKCRDHEKGLASAVVEGAGIARYETVVVMDGDFSHSPEDIPRLLHPLFAENKNIVIGSRYTSGGATPDWPLTRRIGSKVASFPAQLLTEVDDPLSGFFAVSRDTLCAVDPHVQGYKICLEILLGQSRNLNVKEVPISFQDRVAGNSKMTGGTVQSYVQQLVNHCDLALPVKTWRSILPVLLVAILTDISIYTLSDSTGGSPLLSHAAALFGSIGAMSVYFRATCPGRSLRDSGLFRLPSLAPLFLIWLFRIGVYTSLTTSSLAHLLPLLPGLAASLLSAGSLSYVFSRKLFNTPPKTFNTRISFRLTLIGVIAVSFALRFLFAGSFELLKEEAYYWAYAQHLDSGYLDHPPMVALLIHLGTLLLGTTETAVRIGAVFCSGLAACFTYCYTRETASRDTALQAVAIMSVIPAYFMFGLFMTPDAPLIACWAGTLFFLRRALVDLDSKSWLGVGLCLGLGLWSKYTIAFLGPAIVVFMVIDRTSRRLLIKPYPYGAALLALLVFAPVIYWNFQHEWASFLFQTQNRLEASSEFSTHEMVLFILILLSPVGFTAALFFFSGRKKILDSDETTTRNYSFALTHTAVPLLIFFFFSLTKEVKFNWTSPVWLAALPFMAMTLSNTTGALSEAARIRFINSWKITVLVLFLAYGALFHFFAIGLPGAPYVAGGPLWAWDTYAEQLESLADSIEQETGTRPVIVGMDQYKTASGLAFYRTINRKEKGLPAGYDLLHETVGRNIVGSRSAVMYDYWFDSSDYEGRPLIMVSPSQSDLHDRWITGSIGTVGKIEQFSGTRNGEAAAPLLFRKAGGAEQDDH